MKRTIIAIGLAGVLAPAGIFAQKCVNPHIDAQRLDFRDLGYPGATEIPADESPVTALLAHSNGKVYGATSGRRAHLFVYDFRVNKVFPRGRLPGAKGVHHALAEGADGTVYIGTGLNEIELLTLTKDMPHGRRMIETQLWKDIKAKYAGYEGGHLMAYDPAAHDADICLEGADAPVEDLGVAVPGNSIYALAVSPDGKILCGITYPDAEFFTYDMSARKFRRFGKWMEKLSYPGPERSWRGISRALAFDASGKVWSGGDDGLMKSFDPSTGKISVSGMRIPGEYWETQNYDAYPVVEQLFPSADGTLLGTTSDGFVFRAIPAKDDLISFGKPRVERRIRAATMGLDGRMYMIAGEKDNVCRLFSFKDEEGYLDYGVLGVDRSPYYAKIAYQFDSMCTAKDGTVFIGESDRRAKLFFFIPGATVMKGVLNPTNPR